MDNKKWLEERFLSPVVVVYATPEVEESSKRNGMNFRQLLTPFAKATFDIHARTGREDTILVREFCIRLSHPDNVWELPPAPRAQHFRQLIKDFGPQELTNGEQLDAAIDAAIGSGNPVSPTVNTKMAATLISKSFPPWHDQFMRDYVHFVGCSYFETIDHPVGVIIAASTSAKVDVVEQMSAMAGQVPSLRSTIPCMDDEVHMFYILIHDVANSTIDRPEVARRFSAVQNAFGQNRCALMRINSNRQYTSRISPALWVSIARIADCYSSVEGTRKYELPRGSGGNAVGCCFTEEDVSEVQNVMNSYFSSCLVPFLCDKLRKLLQHVQENRQSAFSKMAAWFGSKSDKAKEETFIRTPDAAGAKYLFSAIEIQMRRAGDIAFILRDFDTALTYYKLLRDDATAVVAERPWNRSLIAAAQEAIGLCHYFQGRLPLAGGPRREDNRIEVARDLYADKGIYSFAFRASLILIAHCRNRVPPYNDRALSLVWRSLQMLATNKLYAGFLFDLCASYSLLANPPCNVLSAVNVPPNYAPVCYFRKYARYLALAAECFVAEDFRDMALRSYLRILRVHRALGLGSTWQVMFEAVNKSIAQLFTRDATKRVAFYSAIASQGTPMFTSAQKVAQNFEFFLSQLRTYLVEKGVAFIPHMVVPNVVATSITVSRNTFSEDMITLEEGNNCSAPLQREWKKMEDVLRAHITAARSPVTLPKNWGQKRSSVHYTTAGEVLEIKVEFFNPIGMSLNFEEVALMYMSADGEGIPYTMKPLPSVSVAALSSVVVPLPFVSLSEGKYNVVGVSWKLRDIPGQLLFSTKETAPGQLETPFMVADKSPLPPQSSPDFIPVVVGPPVATLTMDLVPPLPSTFRDGQIWSGELVITNTSSFKAATSVALLRSPDNAHLMYFHERSLKDNKKHDRVFDLSREDIPSKGSIRLKLSIRGQFDPKAAIQNRCINNVPLMLSYATADASPHSDTELSPTVTSPASFIPAMHLRVHRFFRRIVVRPSVKLTTLLLPPAAESLGHTLSVIVANDSNKIDAPLKVGRVVATASQWDVNVVAPESIAQDEFIGCLLTHRQALSIPMQIKRSQRMERKDFVCVNPQDTLRNPAKAELLGKVLGSGLADAAAAQYFLETSLKNSAVPELGREEASPADFSFYLDGAGGSKEQEKAGKGVEVQGPTYPPVAVAVAWCVDEDGSTTFGQLMTIVDIMSAQRMASIGVKGISAAQTTNAKDLVDAFLNNSTPNPRVGVLTFSASHSTKITANFSSSDSPGFVIVHVTIHLRSYAVEPMTVEIVAQGTAGQPPNTLHPQFPYWYCGRTKAVRTIPAGGSEDVEYTAHILGPGLYDLNTMEITARPLRSSKILNDVVVLGEKQVWYCSVELAQQPAGEAVAASPQPMPVGSPARTVGRQRSVSTKGKTAATVKELATKRQARSSTVFARPANVDVFRSPEPDKSPQEMSSQHSPEDAPLEDLEEVVLQSPKPIERTLPNGDESHNNEDTTHDRSEKLPVKDEWNAEDTDDQTPATETDAVTQGLEHFEHLDEDKAQRKPRHLRTETEDDSSDQEEGDDGDSLLRAKAQHQSPSTSDSNTPNRLNRRPPPSSKNGARFSPSSSDSEREGEASKYKPKYSPTSRMNQKDDDNVQVVEVAATTKDSEKQSQSKGKGGGARERKEDKLVTDTMLLPNFDRERKEKGITESVTPTDETPGGSLHLEKEVKPKVAAEGVTSLDASLEIKENGTSPLQQQQLQQQQQLGNALSNGSMALPSGRLSNEGSASFELPEPHPTPQSFALYPSSGSSSNDPSTEAMQEKDLVRYHPPAALRLALSPSPDEAHSAAMKSHSMEGGGTREPPSTPQTYTNIHDGLNAVTPIYRKRPEREEVEQDSCKEPPPTPASAYFLAAEAHVAATTAGAAVEDVFPSAPSLTVDKGPMKHSASADTQPPPPDEAEANNEQLQEDQHTHKEDQQVEAASACAVPEQQRPAEIGDSFCSRSETGGYAEPPPTPQLLRLRSPRSPQKVPLSSEVEYDSCREPPPTPQTTSSLPQVRSNPLSPDKFGSSMASAERRSGLVTPKDASFPNSGDNTTHGTPISPPCEEGSAGDYSSPDDAKKGHKKRSF